MTYDLYYRYRADHDCPWVWAWYASARNLVEVDAHVTHWKSRYTDVPLESQTVLDFGEGEYGIDLDELYDGKPVEGEVRLSSA